MTNLSQDAARAARPALALFQPEIAVNVAAMLRVAACLDVALHLIEPLGFVWDPVRVRRVAMDYAERTCVVRHPSFEAFDGARREAGRRLVLLAPGAPLSYADLAYRPGDLLLGGRESDGVPAHVRERVDLAVRIPMAAGNRSLNLVSAATLVLGEALRQTGTLPRDLPSEDPAC